MKRAKAVAIICISVVLLCSSCSSTSPGEKCGPITGILGAFRNEVTLLANRLTDAREEEIEGIRFLSGRLNGRCVVMAWTGVGTINAAMTTTLLIEHFKPTKVIFTGIAGAVNPQLLPGDIVIGQEVAYHDSGIVGADGLVYSGVKNPLTGIENPIYFLGDEHLVDLALRASEEVKLEPVETTTGERKPKIVKGVVVTGDLFVASSEKCNELREQLGADAVEMEGAAVAQICYQRAIPHIVIRSISDRADEGAIQDKQMFYIIAAKNSARLVAELVRLLASEVSMEKNKQHQ